MIRAHRGQVHRIRIGKQMNIQDNGVLHGERGLWLALAAEALMPERREVPAESVVMGVAAEVRRRVRPQERERFLAGNRNYVGYRQQ